MLGAMDDEQRKNERWLRASVAWVLGLPLLGLLAACALIARSFSVAEAAPPEQKAKLLADGISAAMNGPFAAAVLGALGLPVLVVSLTRRKKPPADP